MTHSLIVGAFGTILALGPPAGGPPEQADGGYHGARICRQVECSPAQEQQLAEIFAAHRAEVAEDRMRAQRLRSEMAAELARSELDTDELQRLQTQLSQTQAKLAQARLQAMIEVHGVLTPAQRETLAEHMATRGPGSGAMKGKRRRGSPSRP